ncbi:MAG: hypothetical protein GY826_31025, partial [Fuerstiella sp.]|nr:hypothetical protein [Fuerstiella sp.]
MERSRPNSAYRWAFIAIASVTLGMSSPVLSADEQTPSGIIDAERISENLKSVEEGRWTASEAFRFGEEREKLHQRAEAIRLYEAALK